MAGQAAIDAGQQPGTTTEDAGRIRALERENRELKRANEIAGGVALGIVSGPVLGLPGAARPWCADRPEQLPRRAAPPAVRPGGA